MGTHDWTVLVDFDGTLTARDADFEIADLALPPGREGAYLPLAEDYEQLRIGMREYFEGYLALLGLDVPAIGRLAERVPLRPGAAALFEEVAARGADIRVLSEGLDVYVLPCIAAGGLGAVPVSCNRASRDNGSWRIEGAPDAEPCGRCLNCKGAHARRARRNGTRVAIVGNGASDLCAAREADLVLARDTLWEHCRAEGIDCVQWQTLEDVAAALRSVL